MTPFDRDYIQIRLEALKLAQSSLQQLMTLSAGGLALYFGFITKAPFAEGVRILGVLVVLLWIASLCSAVVAHWLHSRLFVAISNMASWTHRMRKLQGLTEEAALRMSTADGAGEHDRAKEIVRNVQEDFERDAKMIEATFFPMQDRALRLSGMSLLSLVGGFVVLGVGYVLWLFAV